MKELLEQLTAIVKEPVFLSEEGDYLLEISREPIPNDIVAAAIVSVNGYLLSVVKNNKLSQINILIENSIISGFKSSALGTEQTYLSDRDDQLNLIGLVVSGNGGIIRADGEYKIHTNSELVQILNDGKTIKEVLLQKSFTLKQQVESAINIDEVNDIVVET